MAHICGRLTIRRNFGKIEKRILVFHDPHLPEKVVSHQKELDSRIEKEKNNKDLYISERRFLPTPQPAVGSNQITKISSDLDFWAMNNSWTYCSTCNSLTTKIMPYNFANYACSQSRYVVPRHKDIPSCLLSLP